MGREKGSKNFNRRLLQEALEEKGIDFIGEYYKTLHDADIEIKARMLMHLMEFIYPKRRPVDFEGEAQDSEVVIVTATDEQLLRLVGVTKDEK